MKKMQSKSGKLQKGEKTDLKKIFFTSPCFFGIRDPRSGIRDGKKSGSGIRDKHPGSATLLKSKFNIGKKAKNS
jgi:hypothetical protein